MKRFILLTCAVCVYVCTVEAFAKKLTDTSVAFSLDDQSITILGIKPNGKTIRLSDKIESVWRWRKRRIKLKNRKNKVTVLEPYLIAKIRPPAGYFFKKFKSYSAQVGDDGRLEISIKTKTISIPVTIITRYKKEETDISVIAWITNPKPAILSSPSCSTNTGNFKLILNKQQYRKKAPGESEEKYKDGRNSGGFLYVSMHCIGNWRDRRSIIAGDKTALFILHSGDSTWVRGRFKGQTTAKGKRWQQIVVATPPKKRRKATQGFFRLKDNGSGLKSDIEVRYERVTQEKSNRLSFSSGLGLTYLDYTETQPANTYEFGSVTPTFKINASYKLIPKHLDLAANFFINIVPLSTHASPPTVKGVRFYGINGRFGLKLPGKLGPIRLHLLLGWYIWGMMIPTGSTYGVASLAGPQILLLAKGPGYYSYLKYAPIAVSPSQMSMSDNELAIGGGMVMPFKTFSMPTLLNLDLSRTSITVDRAGLSVSLYTASLGMTFVFY